MAISQDFAQKLSEGSGGKYFALKNDKDFAVVRFMYDSIDQLSQDIYAVHYTDNGKYECKRQNFADPISVCPLCQGGNKPKAVVFISMFNEDTKEAVIWEKSYTWYNNTLLPVLTELLNENPGKSIASFPIKIVRNGATGDMKTVYNLFPKVPDNSTVQSLGVEKATIQFKDYDANAPVDEAPAGNSTPAGNNNPTNNEDSLFRGM